jgi:hypothetical protein
MVPSARLASGLMRGKRVLLQCRPSAAVRGQGAATCSRLAPSTAARARCLHQPVDAGTGGRQHEGRTGWWGASAATALFGGGLALSSYLASRVVDCEAAPGSSSEVKVLFTLCYLLVSSADCSGARNSSSWTQARCKALTAIGMGANRKRANLFPLHTDISSW